MDPDHIVEVVVAHVPQSPVSEDPGIGHHDVETPVGVDRGRHQLLRSLCIADRDPDCGGRAPARLDLLRGSTRLLVVDIVDDHGCPGFGEGRRIGQTETLSAAGDDCDLSRDIHWPSVVACPEYKET